METLPRLREELERGDFDLVVSDYCLPTFDAPRALALFREKNLDVPFIVVSGAVGEDVAVEVMSRGAHDYVLKDRMTRLVPAIERELGEVQERRERRKTETLFHSILRSSPHPSAILAPRKRPDRPHHRLLPPPPHGRPDPRAGAAAARPRRVRDIPSASPSFSLRGGTAPYTVYSVDGQNRVANVRVHTVEHQGTTYANVVIEDVTEQHYLKTAFDAVGDAVLIISSSQTLLYANRAAEELCGAALLRHGRRADAGGSGAWPFPTASRGCRSKERPTRCARCRSASRGGRVVDDPRRFATSRRRRSCSRCRRTIRSPGSTTSAFSTRRCATGGGGALALLDLDRFKPINDELGHSAGDAALIRFAHLIRRELRPGDVFARLGGDEFGILFPGTSVGEAADIVARMYETLERNPFHYDGQSRRLSASCGIGEVVFPVEETKKRVDAALYEAKNSGRGKWVVSSEQRTANSGRELNLSAARCPLRPQCTVSSTPTAAWRTRTPAPVTRRGRAP